MTDEQQWQKYQTLKQQVLPFDFWAEEEEAQQKEEIQKEEARLRAIEELPYFPEPKDDNERLMNFQKEYRQGDEKALQKMFELSYTICNKYVNSITRKDRRVKHLCTFDREVKAENAATYMIEQFVTRPDFFIKKSATAYLWLRVIHEIYYHTCVDKIVDFVNLDDFYKEFYKDKKNDTTRYLLWEEK